MKIRQIFIPGLLAGSLAMQAGDSGAGRPVDATAAFARLKSLAGEWEANTSSGKAHLSYEVVSAGTALVERENAAGMPGMLTVFHLDGGRLLLTHYCMAGNQPRMQANSYDPATGELDFQFLDATSLSNPNDGHMHDVKIRLVDNNHLTSAWQFYENGKPKLTENFQYTRVR